MVVRWQPSSIRFVGIILLVGANWHRTTTPHSHDVKPTHSPKTSDEFEFFVGARCVKDKVYCFRVTSVKVKGYLSRQIRLAICTNDHLFIAVHLRSRCKTSFLDEIANSHAPCAPTCSLHASQPPSLSSAQKVQTITLIAATHLLPSRSSSPSSLVASWQSIGWGAHINRTCPEREITWITSTPQPCSSSSSSALAWARPRPRPHRVL